MHNYASTSEDIVTSAEEEEGVVGSSERTGSDNIVEQMRGSQSSRCGGVKLYCEALQKILNSTCFSDLSS